MMLATSPTIIEIFLKIILINMQVTFDVVLLGSNPKTVKYMMTCRNIRKPELNVQCDQENATCCQIQAIIAFPGRDRYIFI